MLDATAIYSEISIAAKGFFNSKSTDNDFLLSVLHSGTFLEPVLKTDAPLILQVYFWEFSIIPNF